ncbi:MAG TPA: serine hydrolase domain-containing protein [Usitatibacter sp.]|nr:serine hydrolase domain-containing protein [Usitatibacter sp.]
MRIAALLAASLAGATAVAQPLPPIAPDRAGFSTEGLARIDRFFAREIEANRVPGAVVAIARDGKLVYFKAHGFQDKAAGIPMRTDTIFQLASMTKILAAVGGLVLNEEGRLPLKSRLDEYFPAFGKMSVGVVSASGEIALEPQKQPIFIHDLFRHTSGIPYGGRGTTAVHKLWPGGSAVAAAKYDGPEFLATITALPLLHQPGTAWDYSFSTDVLGLVIEKVTGQRLDHYLKSAVWDKVGMPDTFFAIPADKAKRLARPLPTDPLSGKPQKITNLDEGFKFDCAGSCAYGTVGDYLRFGQMLIDGGAIDGKRVLSPKTVAWMTSDHLGPNIRNQVAGTEPHRDGYSWGLGVAVRMHDGVAATPGSKGDFTWNGANGTAFWADPQERLVVVVGTAAPGEIRKYYREQVGALVYGAMTQLRKPK